MAAVAASSATSKAVVVVARPGATEVVAMAEVVVVEVVTRTAIPSGCAIDHGRIALTRQLISRQSRGALVSCRDRWDVMPSLLGSHGVGYRRTRGVSRSSM